MAESCNKTPFSGCIDVDLSFPNLDVNPPTLTNTNGGVHVPPLTFTPDTNISFAESTICPVESVATTTGSVTTGVSISSSRERTENTGSLAIGIDPDSCSLTGIRLNLSLIDTKPVHGTISSVDDAGLYVIRSGSSTVRACMPVISAVYSSARVGDSILAFPLLTQQIM